MFLNMDSVNTKGVWKEMIVIIIILTVFPFLLYIILPIQRVIDGVGNATDWLQFWPGYISAATSALMIFYTYKTLKFSQETLDNNKRQLEEIIRLNTPNVSLSLVRKGNKGYLRIYNCSNSVVSDLSIDTNNSFPMGSNVKTHGYLERAKILQLMRLSISPGHYRDVFLIDQMSDSDAYVKGYLDFTVHFNGGKEKKFTLLQNEWYFIESDEN